MVDAGYGFCGEGIGSEAVDSFGGESDEAPGAEKAGGGGDFRRSGRVQHKSF